MPRFKPEFTACLTDSHSFLLQHSFPLKMPHETSSSLLQRLSWYVTRMLILNMLLRSYSMLNAFFFLFCGNGCITRQRDARWIWWAGWKAPFCLVFVLQVRAWDTSPVLGTWKMSSNTQMPSKNMPVCHIWNEVQPARCIFNALGNDHFVQSKNTCTFTCPVPPYLHSCSVSACLESESHRISWVGRDPWGSLSPTPIRLNNFHCCWLFLSFFFCYSLHHSQEWPRSCREGGQPQPWLCSLGAQDTWDTPSTPMQHCSAYVSGGKGDSHCAKKNKLSVHY